MTIDVERLRTETPGCAHVAHLNNAGAALPPQVVLDTVIEHLRLEATIGGYEAADAAADRLDAVYASIAALVGGEPHEVALVENATRAWDMVFYALPLAAGDRILTARAEYASNAIALLQVARRTGAVVEVVPDDEHGQLSVDALRSMLDERVKLVAVTHVPTQGGLVNPAAAIGEVTRAAGVPFLLDACQSVGQLPVAAGAIGCDALSVTGRKWLRGPRGTGFLWVRDGFLQRLEPPLLDLHAASWEPGGGGIEMRPDAGRFETWERNVAGILGLGAAVDLALALGIDAVAERVRALAEALRARLAGLDGVTVHDQGAERCGIVTFAVDGVDPSALRDLARAAGVNVSVSTAASARWDLDARGITSLVRASPHYYNVEAELDRLCDVVAPGRRAS